MFAHSVTCLFIFMCVCFFRRFRRSLPVPSPSYRVRPTLEPLAVKNDIKKPIRRQQQQQHHRHYKQNRNPVACRHRRRG